MDLRQEWIDQLYRQSTELSNKLVYYLIAVAAAAIGFSVNLSRDAVLSWQLLYLAGAILCWMLSFLAGIRQIRATIKYINLSIIYLSGVSGIHPATGQPVDVVGLDKLDEVAYPMLDKAKEEAMTFAQSQLSWLFVGVVFFITWHAWGIVFR